MAFMISTNKLAEVNRNLNGAAVLCQERIAQVVAAPFIPPTTIPSYFGTWPPVAAYTVTSTETVQLYTDIAGSDRIPATRTTLVSLYSASTNLVRVTARVTYSYRGRNYLAETYCQDLTYVGSMVQTFNSAQFDGIFETSNVYSAPGRKWSFDNMFLSQPPPGTLQSITYSRGRWERF